MAIIKGSFISTDSGTGGAVPFDTVGGTGNGVGSAYDMGLGALFLNHFKNESIRIIFLKQIFQRQILIEEYRSISNH